MNVSRTTVAMVSGIFTIRSHAALNDLEINNPAWWIFCVFAIITLRIFVGAVMGEDWG